MTKKTVSVLLLLLLAVTAVPSEAENYGSTPTIMLPALGASGWGTTTRDALKNLTDFTAIYANPDGTLKTTTTATPWQAVTSTVAYVSTASFSVDSSLASYFEVGRKVWLVQATQVIGSVVSVATVGAVTTVTLAPVVLYSDNLTSSPVTNPITSVSVSMVTPRSDPLPTQVGIPFHAGIINGGAIVAQRGPLSLAQAIVGNTATGTKVVSAISSTVGLYVGQLCTGTGLGAAPNAIASIDSPTQVTLTVNTVTGVGGVTITCVLPASTYAFGPDRFTGAWSGTALTAGVLTQATASAVGRTGYAHHFSGVTLTGTGILYHRHRIESRIAKNYKNQQASFSVKVLHDIGSNVNFTVYIRKPTTTADVFSAVTEIANSGAIAVASGSSTTVTFQNVTMGDCSKGIEIEVKAEAGAITAKNLWLTEYQLEVGAVITEFKYKVPQEELTLCERYYETSYDYGVPVGTITTTGVVSPAGYSAYYLGGNRFRVKKRTVAPTVTLYSPSGTVNKCRAISGAVDNTSTALAHASYLNDSGYGLVWDSGAGGFTSAASNIWVHHYSASDEL